MSKLQEIENLPEGKAGCRFAELQEFLPDISERTLHYDLQALIDKGMVERMGGAKYILVQLQDKVSEVIELPGVSSVSL